MLLSNLGSTVALDLYNPNIVWRKKYQKAQEEWLIPFNDIIWWGCGGGGALKQNQNYDKTLNTMHISSVTMKTSKG